LPKIKIYSKWCYKKQMSSDERSTQNPENNLNQENKLKSTENNEVNNLINESTERNKFLRKKTKRRKTKNNN